VQFETYLHEGHCQFTTNIAPVIALYGWPIFTEFVMYVGLLPWPLALWACLYVRKAYFIAILAPLYVLALCAYSELGATAIYYAFPLFRFFRPVQYSACIIPLFLLLAAGFGLDDLLEKGRKKQLTFLVGAIVAWGLLAVVVLPLFWPFLGLHPHLNFPQLFANSSAVFFLLRIAAYMAGLWALWRFRGESSRSLTGDQAPPSQKLFGVVVVLCLAFDLLLFRLMVTAEYSTIPPGEESLVRARPLRFVPERTDPYVVRFFPQGGGPVAVYVLQHQLDEIDAAVSMNRPLLVAAGVHDLMSARHYQLPERFLFVANSEAREKLLQEPTHSGMNDPWLAAVIASNGPKLRVCFDATFAGDHDTARRLAAEATEIGTVLLEGMPPEVPPSRVAAPAKGHAEVVGFSANDLTVQVDVKGDRPGWLVYADGFHPDWTATVNGAPVETLRANLAFKAVPVPPGRSTVHWHFGKPLRVSLAYGLMALGVCLAILGLASVAGCVLGLFPQKRATVARLDTTAAPTGGTTPETNAGLR
jgi:hypothetical protein